MERYAAQYMDSLEKNSKFQFMDHVKINPTKAMDMKKQIMRDYMDPVKRKEIKNRLKNDYLTDQDKLTI